MIERAGPAAEFFTIITHSGHAARMGCRGGFEKVDGFFYGLKWNEVTQTLQAGENADRAAAIFRNVIAE